MENNEELTEISSVYLVPPLNQDVAVVNEWINGHLSSLQNVRTT